MLSSSAESELTVTAIILRSRLNSSSFSVTHFFRPAIRFLLPKKTLRFLICSLSDILGIPSSLRSIELLSAKNVSLYSLMSSIQSCSGAGSFSEKYNKNFCFGSSNSIFFLVSNIDSSAIFRMVRLSGNSSIPFSLSSLLSSVNELIMLSISSKKPCSASCQNTILLCSSLALSP